MRTIFFFFFHLFFDDIVLNAQKSHCCLQLNCSLFTAAIKTQINYAGDGLWIGARDLSTSGTTPELGWADNTEFVQGDWVLGQDDFMNSPQPKRKEEKVN